MTAAHEAGLPDGIEYNELEEEMQEIERDERLTIIEAFCTRVHARACQLSVEQKTPVAYCYRLAVERELVAIGGDVSVLKG